MSDVRKPGQEPSKTPGQRRAFYISGSHDENGYWPSLVVEGQWWAWPMFSPSDGTSPWYWGVTLEEAQEKCDLANREDFGLEPEEAQAIIDSSYRLVAPSYSFWLYQAPADAVYNDDWLALGELGFGKPRSVIIRDLEGNRQVNAEMNARLAYDEVVDGGGSIEEARKASDVVYAQYLAERRAVRTAYYRTARAAEKEAT